MCELFEKLNEPFPYEDYEYNKEDDRVYVNGQAIAERLNRVLGVGYWCYEPIENSIKVVQRKGYQDKVINMITLLVNFQFYNKDLKEWVKFTDAGSQDLNIKMTEGDGTKAAITDGMKKCASRIGVASDLYKGLIKSQKDPKHPDGGYAILPESYKTFYETKGWKWPTYKTPVNTPPQTQAQPAEYKCFNTKCNKPISEKVHKYSMDKFKKPYCQDCQKKIIESQAAKATQADKPAC